MHLSVQSIQNSKRLFNQDENKIKSFELWKDQIFEESKMPLQKYMKQNK